MTILSLAVCTIIVYLCAVSAYQYMKLKSCATELSKEKSKCYSIELEKAALSERCVRFSNLENEHRKLLEKCLQLEKEKILLASNLEQEKKNLAEKIKLLEEVEKKFTDTFKALSSDALSQNNRSFIELAKSEFARFQEKAKSDLDVKTKSVNDLMMPIKNALTDVDNKLGELEKSRIGAYESLKQQVKDLIDTQNSLKAETCNLAAALKNPAMRGMWGEMQLKRVVEISGMTEHCDFDEQVALVNEETNIRPDMVIYFPAGKNIVVDAKTPFSAYLEALNTSDENQKKILLDKHVQQIRKHVSVLADKKYWSQFKTSPEFVVMFLPGEVFFSTAAERDPTLIEFAMQKKVIIATPMSLIALLRTIALGWKNESLTQHAHDVVKMGQELYKRLADMSVHILNLGKNINSAVTSYNKTIASLESRVLVTARRFKDLETQDKNIADLNEIEQPVKQLEYRD